MSPRSAAMATAAPREHAMFAGREFVASDSGPLYIQLKRFITGAIGADLVGPGDALPSERDIAERLGVSRVTVRKAVQDLVRDGVLVQRHGSGTYVMPQPHRVEQSLSYLTSFAEDMARRGMAVRSIWLDRGRYAASPEEAAALDLNAAADVTRIVRLRLHEDMPLAVERATLSFDLLPDPHAIGASLYEHLGRSGNRPVRALQRIRAVTIDEETAELLQVSAGSAGLHIERTSYLASGRIVEFTRSMYRGDTYDFVAELKLEERLR